MSAIYNWAYKPSVINKYSFTVPAGADNARPAGWCYVALFGNDTIGNGSRNAPYRTLTKAMAIAAGGALNIVIGSGVYREVAVITTGGTFSFIGDGDVTIDFTYNKNFTNQVFSSGGLYNLKLVGNGVDSYFTTSFSGNTNIYKDVVFQGCWISTNFQAHTISNIIVYNFLGLIFLGNVGPIMLSNCTFVGCNYISINDNNSGIITGCIFVGCNIGFTGGVLNNNVRYSLFFQSNFVLNGTGAGGAVYPTTPAGYTYYATITALQTAYNALYATPGFIGCTIADPLFNNLSIGDYSLAFNSPAKNLSYFGTYVGAKSIAYPIKASATESLGSFDFSTNINLNIANDSITLVNTSVNGEIKTKMIINAAGRQIQKLPIFGFNADRNGQYIDSIPDLDTVVKNAGDALSVPASYLVETGALTYNGNLYQPGDRLTTVTGQTTFTSTVSGTLREILEAPERHTVMARFSDGGAAVNVGDALVAGYWYYVVTGAATYAGTTYNAGQGFKAVDTNAFSGVASVIVAFDTQAFNHYEPGIQPTTNNAGDSRTGAIIRGNGDPAYVRGGYGVQEFPVNAKFIQMYYIINVGNLKP